MAARRGKRARIAIKRPTDPLTYCMAEPNAPWQDEVDDLSMLPSTGSLPAWDVPAEDATTSNGRLAGELVADSTGGFPSLSSGELEALISGFPGSRSETGELWPPDAREQLRDQDGAEADLIMSHFGGSLPADFSRSRFVGLSQERFRAPAEGTNKTHASWSQAPLELQPKSSADHSSFSILQAPGFHSAPQIQDGEGSLFEFGARRSCLSEAPSAPAPKSDSRSFIPQQVSISRSTTSQQWAALELNTAQEPSLLASRSSMPSSSGSELFRYRIRSNALPRKRSASEGRLAEFVAEATEAPPLGVSKSLESGRQRDDVTRSLEFAARQSTAADAPASAAVKAGGPDGKQPLVTVHRDKLFKFVLQLQTIQDKVTSLRAERRAAAQRAKAVERGESILAKLVEEIEQLQANRASVEDREAKVKACALELKQLLGDAEPQL